MDHLKIATARAGNVIGGGDWAKDRIVCDCIHALTDGSQALIRNPNSTRPWQLVLEPLSGYLLLAANLYKEATEGGSKKLNGESFNFGPRSEVEVTVAKLLEAMHERWPKFNWREDPSHAIQNKEAFLLKLNCDKALRHLRWKPTFAFDETIDFVTAW
jgi:CDP-glucose 4,6-dehydratase